MIQLNPVEYPILNKKQLTIKRIDSKKFEVINSSDNRLYYGKKVQIFLNNTSYIGRYTYSHINETITNYLIFEGTAPTSTGTFNVTIYETFIIPEDNQAITFQDLQEKFKENKIPVIIENVSGINDIGSNNIVDGFQTLKIDQSLFGFKTNKTYSFNNQNYQEIFLGKVEENKLNKYQIFLYPTNNTDNSLFINFEIGITGDCKKYYIKNNSHFTQQSSFDYIKNQYLKSTNELKLLNNEFVLQIEKIEFTSGNYISVKLRLNTLSETILNLEGYISCRHPEDLWHPDVSLSSNTTLLNFNGQNEISIDQTLLYADNNGEQRTIIYGESILKEIEINSSTNIVSLKPGYYKVLSSNKPISIPGNNDNSLNSNYFKTLIWSNATLVVLQENKYLFYTDKGYVFIGYKKDSKVYWDLFSIYGHTHSTDDLTVGNNKFVTQKQIDDWNATKEKVDNYSWRPYLLKDDGTEDTQNIKNSIKNTGDTVLLFNKIDDLPDYKGNPIIYVKDSESKLIPLSIGALTVESKQVKNPQDTGTLVKQETIDKLLGLGIGLRTNEDNEQYILINNLTTYYQERTNKNIKFFDLVKRTGNVKPGNNSINIGFDNSVLKNNSIFYGIGLKLHNLTDTDKIIFGKYNNPLADNIIEFGIGTSNTDRKNAFWYTKNNLFVINGNFFNNNDNEIGYLLVNGSDPIINDFVHIEEFVIVENKVNEIFDNTTFIKLVPLDTNIKPLIKRIYFVNDNSEFNTYNLILKLNNLNDFGNSTSGLKSNYKFYTKYIDDDNFEELEITNKDFDDDNTLIIFLSKDTILKIINTLNNKEVIINLFDYINSSEYLDEYITINITNI